MPSRTWKTWTLASVPSAATPIRSAVPTEPPAIRWRSNSDLIAVRRSRWTAARSNSRAVGGLLHLRLLVGLDPAVAAGEEVDDRVDVAAVLLLADVADAGRPAALDVVVEAGAAGAAAGLRALAGAELEQLAEQVERLAHPLGAREGAEVGAAGAVLLAGEVDARVVLVEADRDVGVGLVVAEADVEARPVALDEALLGEQRLGLVGGDQDVEAVDPRGEPRLAAGEVRGDPFADRARLADVEQLAVAVVEEVDAGGVGQLAALLGDPLGAGRRRSRCSSSAIGQRVGSWPHGQTCTQRDGESAPNEHGDPEPARAEDDASWRSTARSGP